jgi:hypothetical protein
MDVEQNVGGTDRIVRAALAVGLTVAALLALQAGRRTVSVLAASGAIALGFNAVTCFCGLNEALGIDTTTSE